MDLAQYDVIVPVWSFGIQHRAALQAVLAAVAQGVGLATFHGGIDWFADRDYARMIGGHFVFHPPSNQYTVVIDDPSHPITLDLADFCVATEQYYFHVDPGNHVLTSTPFGDLRMPNTWVRTYGTGRVLLLFIGAYDRRAGTGPGSVAAAQRYSLGGTGLSRFGIAGRGHGLAHSQDPIPILRIGNLDVVGAAGQQAHLVAGPLDERYGAVLTPAGLLCLHMGVKQRSAAIGVRRLQCNDFCARQRSCKCAIAHQREPIAYPQFGIERGGAMLAGSRKYGCKVVGARERPGNLVQQHQWT